MRSLGFRILFTISASCLLLLPAASAQTSGGDTPLVRLSFVQGDVRLSSGNGTQADLSKKWEQADADLVIQQGFSLATGDGRAEIEFENGSWVWLAENSVLIFQDLHTKSGSTAVSLMLISGIGSFFVNRGPSDTFDIKTPVNEISLEDSAFIRVNSFLDGTLVTDLQNAKASGVPDPSAEKGATFALPGSSLVTPDGLSNTDTPTDWDSWVSSRLKKNQAAMSDALKQSGLTTPIPGLEELPQEGSFFPCPPTECAGTPLWLPSKPNQARLPAQPLRRAPMQLAPRRQTVHLTKN
jgi:FecR protein